MSEITFPGDSYQSSPAEVERISSFIPSLAFLWKLLRIIFRDGRLAESGNYDSSAWSKGSFDTLRSLEQCGVKVSVTGMNNIDKVDGPCVFIANHMSTLETFILPIFIQPRKELTFVTKESLVKYPVFGHVLRSRNPITVGRQNPRDDLTAVLQGGEERLASGRSIIIFPQSTRSTSFDLENFNTLGIKLAKRAKVPVIPIALKSDAWGVGRIIRDLPAINPELPVHFAFGEPMDIPGNGKTEHQMVCDFIAENLNKWNLPVPLHN